MKRSKTQVIRVVELLFGENQVINYWNDEIIACKVSSSYLMRCDILASPWRGYLTRIYWCLRRPSTIYLV